MTERPVLDKNLDSKTFRNFYDLREKLVDFCRKNGLPAFGRKIEITNDAFNFKFFTIIFVVLSIAFIRITC